MRLAIPDEATITRVKNVLETLLLVMLVPLVVVAILRDPRNAGERALGTKGVI